MRADALQNRRAILAAAREMFMMEGLAVPLDAIAQRAGVSIATLYRRFPDRVALVRAVARDAMGAVEAAASDATARSRGDAEAAWHGFAAAVGGLGLGVLMPLMLPTMATMLADDEVVAARDRMLAAVTSIVAAAQHRGAVRTDVSPPEVMLLLVSVTRPLPACGATLPGDATARWLRIVVAGLRPVRGQRLPGQPLAREQIEEALRSHAARAAPAPPPRRKGTPRR